MRFKARLAVVCAGWLVAACAPGGLAGQTGDGSAGPTSSESSSCQRSVMTGTCTDPAQPVLVVKIDDVREARPQFNLNSADMILVEPVEGGLTRLMAVYQSQRPNIVGPIRSARITDTDLVSAFGRPGFAYSGAQKKLVPYLQAASMQLVGAPQGGLGYSRLTDRAAPHNYIGDFAALTGRIKDPVAAQLVTGDAWSFGDAVPGGTEVHEVAVDWPAAEKSFVWDDTKSAWAEYVYGNRLFTQLDLAGATEPVNASNVVIMQTELQASEFGDKLGNKTPYPQTIGSGKGLVLTQGRVYQAEWRRPSKTDLPRWFAADGTEIELAAGNVWWLIVTDLGKVTLKLAR